MLAKPKKPITHNQSISDFKDKFDYKRKSMNSNSKERSPKFKGRSSDWQVQQAKRLR